MREARQRLTGKDLENIIAVCEQEEHSDISVPAKLAKRCRDTLAYRDVNIRLTKHNKAFLASMYDEDMDEDAKETLDKILL